MLRNYYSPTPKIYRQLGDLFLILIPVVQGGIANAPNFSDQNKYWTGFICTCILIIAKFVTNLFKDDTATLQDTPSDTTP